MDKGFRGIFNFGKKKEKRSVDDGFVPGYYAEMAQLQLQVKLYDKAIQTADLGLKSFPDSGDLYLIKGLSLIFSGDKQQGLSLLEEAKSHGVAEKADELIKKYK